MVPRPVISREPQHYTPPFGVEDYEREIANLIAALGRRATEKIVGIPLVQRRDGRWGTIRECAECGEIEETTLNPHQQPSLRTCGICRRLEAWREKAGTAEG